MTSDSGRTLVFYLLDSEDAAIGHGERRYVARYLAGYHVDFWADFEPYLTVLTVPDFMREADRVEAELSNEEQRAELGRVREWIHSADLPVVGYQLETVGGRSAEGV